MNNEQNAQHAHHSNQRGEENNFHIENGAFKMGKNATRDYFPGINQSKT